jgi:hypothetical protein
MLELGDDPLHVAGADADLAGNFQNSGTLLPDPHHSRAGLWHHRGNELYW